MMAAQRGRCFSRAAEGLVFLPVPGRSAVRWHPHPEMRTVPPMVSPPPRGQDGAALRMAARAKRDPAKAATPTSNGCLGRGEGGGDGAACRFVEAGADRAGRIVFHSIPPHLSFLPCLHATTRLAASGFFSLAGWLQRYDIGGIPPRLFFAFLQRGAAEVISIPRNATLTILTFATAPTAQQQKRKKETTYLYIPAPEWGARREDKEG